MKLAVLLTTWNRPKLFRQCVNSLLTEMGRYGVEAPLVICDDRSTDRDTIETLDRFMEAGSLHAQGDPLVPPLRVTQPPGPRPGSAHHSTGQNNLHGFRFLLDAYPETTHVLKIDDDVVLAPNAIHAMVAAREAAIAAGFDVLLTSGMFVRQQREYERHEFWRSIAGACAACCIFDAADWRDMLADHDPQHLLNRGFDGYFTGIWSVKKRPGAAYIAPYPSVAYHAGFSGVHSHGDVNVVDFKGDVEGLIRGG